MAIISFILSTLLSRGQLTIPCRIMNQGSLHYKTSQDRGKKTVRILSGNGRVALDIYKDACN